MRTLLLPFLQDRFLHLLLLIAVLLACLVPFSWRALPAAVDGQTIITLAGLLILTKGIEASGYFDWLGRRLIQRFQHERGLALFMVAASALLSTFLTNDVALFITVPLTLTLRKYSTLPVSRLIIFEALAVNAGSLLTPMGNPQNILLWRHGDAGFIDFITQMLPLAALMMASLLLLTACSFRARPLQRHPAGEALGWQRPLLFTSVLLYGVFFLLLEHGLAPWGLALVLLVFLLRAPRLLLSLDWSLLLVFVVMFIDVWLLMRLPLLQQWLPQVQQMGEGQQFLLAAGLSQLISNVPTTILLLNMLPASTLLAWAVNIGGFGLLPGSLANLIALRMARDRAIWWQFHLFSLPMLAWALLSGWLLWRLLS
ncbi:SLC13 family permease [Pantoea sp. 1.19]|uniref:SLC13 family permease n=1 Tax=Pantoea sp. 1.19 TaxID=1925589 RepID=UPI000948ED75|nr:SLC13 family permease [Pantoea sp. 1.19]